MANSEHVALARRRSFAIARWREQNWRSRAKLDLSGAYLSGAKLPGADLSHDDLSGVDLTSSDLHNANLAGTNLESAHLSRSNLAWANLRDANLKGVSLVRSNLRGCNLQGVDLQGADLSFADLSLADLSGANLAEADLTQSNLSQVDLTGASLCRAALTAANLDIANLSRVDLRGASLVRARLDGTLLSDVRLEMTLFGDCDLGHALGLESAQHSGPSIIGLDTLVRSQGLIPGAFLRQAGVPGDLIELQLQLASGASRYSRMLLLGSVKDAEFIERLQDDLRASGMACWRLTVDDDEAILGDGVLPPTHRLAYYDQMVLVCSEHSLGSLTGWRFFEQIAQTQDPARIRKNAIVPVPLDRSLQTMPGRVCEDLLRHKVVDFSQWRDAGVYQRALGELIRVLGEERQPAQSEGPLSPVGD